MFVEMKEVEEVVVDDMEKEVVEILYSKMEHKASFLLLLQSCFFFLLELFWCHVLMMYGLIDSSCSCVMFFNQSYDGRSDGGAC